MSYTSRHELNPNPIILHLNQWKMCLNSNHVDKLYQTLWSLGGNDQGGEPPPTKAVLGL